jgi:glycosyltransferase involved in cell wall biosynthesis
MQVHGFEFARYLQKRSVDFVIITSRPESAVIAEECTAFDAKHDFPCLRILPRESFAESMQILEATVRDLRPSNVFASQVSFAPSMTAAGRVVCRSAGNDVLRPWIAPNDLSYHAMQHLSFDEQRLRLKNNRQWVREAANSAAIILCNSEWTKERLVELGISNVATVIGGVSTGRFRPNEKKSELKDKLGLPLGSILTIVGRLVLKKGVDVAIEAMRHVAPTASLVVLGDGPELLKLRAITDELQLNDRVHFLGKKPHHELHQFIAASDIVLVPSRSIYDPSRFAYDHETMCRVVCEASSCGVAVVASNVGGIPSVLKDGKTGVLVRQNDPEELATIVNQLLSDDARRRSLGNEGRRFATENLCFEYVNKLTFEHVMG